MSYKKMHTKSAISDVDEDKGIVKIQVSAFNNVDSYGDIMHEKAFNKTIADFNSGARTRVKHLKNHDPSQLLGIPLEMSATKDGLVIVSKINLDKTLGRETFSDYKFFAENGDTLEHSIGYQTVKKENTKAGLLLKEVRMFEYSTLDFLGANPETPLLGLKNTDMTSEELKDALERIEALEAAIIALQPSEDTEAVKEEVEEEIIDEESDEAKSKYDEEEVIDEDETKSEEDEEKGSEDDKFKSILIKHLKEKHGK
jgi:phage head maturation protease